MVQLKFWKILYEVVCVSSDVYRCCVPTVICLFKISPTYCSLEIHNLSIGHSEVELRAGEGIGIVISNVSAVFKGTIKYGYGSWL